MSIKMNAQDVILADGINVNDAFMLAFNRIDSNRYDQPQIGILTASPITIAADTYPSAQYVKVPFASYTRFNNHAHNVIDVDENGHLVTYDGFRYFFFYRFHENVSTPSAANVSAIDDYQRLVFANDNSNYVATGRDRDYLPTFLTATNYLHDININGFFGFLNQPTRPLDFEVYVSSVASTYKFERFEFLYIATPLEME